MSDETTRGAPGAAPPGRGRGFGYGDAIDWLMSFADFERGAASQTARSRRRRGEPEFALDRIRSLLGRLGSPQRGRLTVHVAGSKGKGSTAAMIESILRAAGRRTGMFSSPHLHSFRERIRIDGEPLPEEYFARLCDGMRLAAAEELAERPGRISTFELLTALAFTAFRDQGVDAQIVEVGLGGRLDCTNVFDEKDAAVITALSHEHTEILGDRIEQIAGEKAGIITPGTRGAVLAPQRSEPAAAVVRAAADGAQAPLVDVARAYEWSPAGTERSTGPRGRMGQWFELRRARPRRGEAERMLLLTPLLGEFQIENAAAAVAAIDLLASQGLKIPRAAIHRGIATVDWPARLELLPVDPRQPRIVVDGAHNAESVERALEAVRAHFPHERLVAVFGALGDKALAGMAERIAEHADVVIATESEHPRARPAADVAAAFKRLPGAPQPRLAPRAADALAAARAAARRDDLICVLGSLSLAAQVRELVLQPNGPAGSGPPLAAGVPASAGDSIKEAPPGADGGERRTA